MKPFAVGFFLIAFGAALGSAWAGGAGNGSFDASQLEQYVSFLLADRAAYAVQIDQLRLQFARCQREQPAMIEQRAKEVDDYWRRWTGVDAP